MTNTVELENELEKQLEELRRMGKEAKGYCGPVDKETLKGIKDGTRVRKTIAS